MEMTITFGNLVTILGLIGTIITFLWKMKSDASKNQYDIQQVRNELINYQDMCRKDFNIIDNVIEEQKERAKSEVKDIKREISELKSDLHDIKLLIQGMDKKLDSHIAVDIDRNKNK